MYQCLKRGCGERVIWYSEQHTFFPMVLQAHKIGDVQGWVSRRYVGAILAGGMIALLAYAFFFLRMSYQFGGLTISNRWFYMYNDLYTYQEAAGRMANLSDPSAVARVCVIVGAATMWALMAAHRAYVWWPLHPLGFLLACGYTSKCTWFGLLTGWAAKTAIVRYGGKKIYCNVRPLFIGLILGDVSGQAFSSVVAGAANEYGTNLAAIERQTPAAHINEPCRISSKPSTPDRW